MHDNEQAIRLYERLGFERAPVFALKNKNAYNEPLFMACRPTESLNPYAMIINNEPRRRGIGIEIVAELIQIQSRRRRAATGGIVYPDG
jgi:hypothetical protein